MKTRILIADCSIFDLLRQGFCCRLLVRKMKPIKLPEPKLDQSKSLAQVLKDRKTRREYSSGNLSPQVSFKPAMGCMGHQPGRFR